MQAVCNVSSMDDEVIAELLTATQAAGRLGVNPVTVTRWAKAGFLPFVTVPPYDKRMYRVSDVADLVERRRAAAK